MQQGGKQRNRRVHVLFRAGGKEVGVCALQERKQDRGRKVSVSLQAFPQKKLVEDTTLT